MKFFTALLVLTTAVAVSAQPRIPVDIYAESLCPFCRQIIDQLADIVKEEGILTAMDFDFLPYGNARNHSGVITCQHGPNECYGNLAEACAKSLLGNDPLKYMPFVQCLEKPSSTMSEQNVDDCARKTNVDLDNLHSCMSGPRGTSLINKEGAKTQKANIPGTPTIHCNGRSINGPDGIIPCVCRAYTGTKPPACNRQKMCLREN